METERTSRRYHTADERRRIAGRCESSGLSQGQFASRHRISLSSLQRWLREFRASSNEASPLLFREVAVAPPLIGSASPVWAVEIVSPDGTTVRCRQGLSIDEIARLLRDREC